MAIPGAVGKWTLAVLAGLLSLSIIRIDFPHMTNSRKPVRMIHLRFGILRQDKLHQKPRLVRLRRIILPKLIFKNLTRTDRLAKAKHGV
ncbi:MAG: hypothetical protein BA864_11365 [Desulfuromonadales bacterium C00003093]|nr:MAG: hypothetical protein BA864_11365 [Desulfuromonadales bacterium C00003093]